MEKLPLNIAVKDNNSPNSLLRVSAFLSSEIANDPLLCLAQAVAWLDPFWNAFGEDAFDEDYMLFNALDVVRHHFPGIYALAVEALHHGAGYEKLDQLICAEISTLGIPLDCIESMSYGIPLPAYGTLLHDPEFYAYHPDIVPIVKLFGIQPEDDYPVDVPDRAYHAMHQLMTCLIDHPDARYQQVGWLMGWLGSATGNSNVLCGIKNRKSSGTDELTYPIDIPDEAYTAARIIADDLAEHSDEHYRQVSWLIQWLFGISQNSCVDWPPDVMYEVEPLSWDAEDVAFAIEIIKEADTIMTDAFAGLQWLRTQPVVMWALWANIQRIYHALAKQPGENVPLPSLIWPDICSIDIDAQSASITAPECPQTESS